MFIGWSHRRCGRTPSASPGRMRLRSEWRLSFGGSCGSQSMNDISLRGLGVGVLIVLSGIGASLLLAWAVVAETGAPAEGPNGARPPQIEGAVLQTAPHGSLEEFARGKRARLE